MNRYGDKPPFSMHVQSWWREQAKNADHDMWFRIMALALGTHRRNGHAGFGVGEIARELKVTDRKVSDGIRIAKKHGVIDNNSCSRCLIVPAHGIQGGLGHENDACAWHDGKRTGRRNKPQNRTYQTDHTDTPVAPELASQAESEAIKTLVGV